MAKSLSGGRYSVPSTTKKKPKKKTKKKGKK